MGRLHTLYSIKHRTEKRDERNMFAIIRCHQWSGTHPMPSNIYYVALLFSRIFQETTRRYLPYVQVKPQALLKHHEDEENLFSKHQPPSYAWRKHLSTRQRREFMFFSRITTEKKGELDRQFANVIINDGYAFTTGSSENWALFSKCEFGGSWRPRSAIKYRESCWVFHMHRTKRWSVNVRQMYLHFQSPSMDFPISTPSLFSHHD